MNAIVRTPILRWMDDETFFSICSRQHCYFGNSDAHATFDYLFGSTSAHTLHDFPYNLDQLNPDVEAIWGSSISIILKHTILPFFMPFQSPARTADAIETLKGPKVGSLKYRMGLLTGRFGAEHPLKACAMCMVSDWQNQGVAYWHLSHQYPGVMVCPVHHIPLRESRKNRQWTGRFQWFLPTEEVLLPIPSFMLNPECARDMEEFTGAVLELAALGANKTFEPSIVHRVYREAIATFVPPGSDLQDAAASFACHNAHLCCYPQLSSLPTSLKGASALLDQLRRPPRGHSHPLKHLSVITWLYRSFSHFIECYDRQISSIPKSDTKCSLSPVCLHVSSRLTPKTGTPRSKILKPKVRLWILQQLARGEEKNKICSDIGITISTINKLLRSEAKVRQSWEAHKFNDKLSINRSRWCSATMSIANEGVKNIRARLPEVYAWLYRNDRKWLNEKNTSLASKRIGNNSSVDWERRDIELSDSIKSYLKLNSNFQEGSSISRHEFYQFFPKLPRALEKTDRYPRTRKILQEIFLKKPGEQSSVHVSP